MRVETIYRTIRNNIESEELTFSTVDILFTYFLHFNTISTDILTIIYVFYILLKY